MSDGGNPQEERRKGRNNRKEKEKRDTEVKPKPHARGRELAPSFERRNVKELVDIPPTTLGLDFHFRVSCLE